MHLQTACRVPGHCFPRPAGMGSGPVRPVHVEAGSCHPPNFY